MGAAKDEVTVEPLGVRPPMGHRPGPERAGLWRFPEALCGVACKTLCDVIRFPNLAIG